MATQQVNFGFTSTGAAELARDFRKTGDTALLAAKGARAAADALKASEAGGKAAADGLRKAERAANLLDIAEHELNAELDKTNTKLLEQLGAAEVAGAGLKKAGRDAKDAGGGFSGLAGLGGIPGGGLGAAIAAGVALSPVLVTVGTGLAGLGAAAYKTISPILEAGTATKQARDALASLDPAQQTAYDSLGKLKTQFATFSKSLEPQVLDIFSRGLRIASGLMGDIAPVAKATGDALGVMLGQIDAEFKSRTWQDFFGFMAAQAGPDVKLLANALLPLLDTLPKLLTDIQPVAVQLLQAAGGAARLADAAVTLNDKIKSLGVQADHSGGLVGRIADAAKNAVGQMLPGIPAAQKLAGWLGTLGANSDKAATSTGKAGDAFAANWPKAQTYAQWVQQGATATTNLMNAQQTALDKQTAYGNALVTSGNDAQAFHDKLQASKGMIGLHTQAERDSFGAANTYISDLGRQASAAVSSGHGTDAAITAIRNGLPALDSAKTKNKQYWQEVQTLRNWLKQLELVAFEKIAIHVTGAGSWSVAGRTVAPGVAHGPQNIGAAPGGFAAGAYISAGSGPTADDVLVRASKGELIVPANMVAAGWADNMRGMIPGFAQGGVAGSYGPGSIAGLPRWASGRMNATTTAIGQMTADAVLAAMRAAQAAAKAAAAFSPFTGPLGKGPISRSAAVAQAFAKSIMWAYGWKMDQWPYLQALWNQESGWNSYAANPASNARGIPQNIHGWSAYAPGDYQAQIRWGMSYIKNRPGYGTPAAAWAHEKRFNWYSEGGLIPGYAAGGTVTPAERQGQTYLNAWRSRRGGPYALAVGPRTLNQQIPDLAAAISRAQILSRAGGLSAGQHRFWAGAAAADARLLATRRKELTTERAWSGQLGAADTALSRQITAAGNLPALAGPVRGWKAQIAAHQHTIGQIGAMVGLTAAQAAAAALPKITHTYGGDVAGTIGAFLQSVAAPFGAARGALLMDTGGTLQPGWQPVYNGTGRPETLVPARGGGGTLQIEWVGGNGSDELERWIRKNVRVRGGTGPGAVDRAYGSR